MSRIPLSLAGVVGLVAALFIAAPAQAAPYAVTAYLDKTSADVGQTVKVSGTVSGSNATNKRLLVQRRVGSGAWANIGQVYTGANKKFYFFHQVSAVGAQQFRVYAPAGGSSQAGLSPAKSFTGWTWLFLTQQPHGSIEGSAFWDTSPTVKGAKRAHSAELFTNGTQAFWDLDNACDQSKVVLGTYDGTSGSVTPPVGTDEGAAPATVAAGTAVEANYVTLASDYLTITKTSGSGTLVVVTPRVHCSIARLPDPSN